MDPALVAGLLEQNHKLQRQIHSLQMVFAVGLIALLAYAWTTSASAQPATQAAPQVLRVRGIIIEDEQGRPRILLGAPVPSVAERKRQDPATGLIVLGENGADRLQIGQVGGPQMGGKVQPRVSPATGLMVNDASGDERAGFGGFENGQVGWGLDWPDGEAIVAAVMPDRGFAGIVLSGPQGESRQRGMWITTREGKTVFQVHDTNGAPRASLSVEGTAAPALQILDPDGKVLKDLAADQK